MTARKLPILASINSSLGILAASVFLAAIPVAAQGEAGSGPSGHPCPDKKATQVEASTKPADGATVRTCGIGVVIFGFGGGILGESCPTLEVTTPAHQECLGEENRDTMCVPDGNLRVMGKKCKCGGLVIPGLEVGIPISCNCGDSFELGHVEDSETVLCPDA